MMVCNTSVQHGTKIDSILHFSLIYLCLFGPCCIVQTRTICSADLMMVCERSVLLTWNTTFLILVFSFIFVDADDDVFKSSAEEEEAEPKKEVISISVYLYI